MGGWADGHGLSGRVRGIGSLSGHLQSAFQQWDERMVRVKCFRPGELIRRLLDKPDALAPLGQLEMVLHAVLDMSFRR